MLDEWFEQEVQPRLKGRSFLIRYADDFVMGFSCEEDARRVMDVLPKRFEKYGLTIHPDKTRLVPFERPSGDPKGTTSEARTPAGTFDLLGFTHYWARSRQGNWVVKRKTSKSRFRRGLEALSRMVSAQPPPTDGGPAPDAESEAHGSLRVLRDHRQLAGTEPFPRRGHMDLEALAVAPSARWPDDLGPPQSLPEAPSASASDRGPLGVPSRSVHVT